MSAATNCHTCAWGGGWRCGLLEEAVVADVADDVRGRAKTWWTETWSTPKRLIGVEARGCPSHRPARLWDRWMPRGEPAVWNVYGDIYGHSGVPEGAAGTSGVVLAKSAPPGRVWVRSSSEPDGQGVVILGAPFYTLSHTLQSRDLRWTTLLSQLGQAGYRQARDYFAATAWARARAALQGAQGNQP